MPLYLAISFQCHSFTVSSLCFLASSTPIGQSSVLPVISAEVSHGTPCRKKLLMAASAHQSCCCGGTLRVEHMRQCGSTKYSTTEQWYSEIMGSTSSNGSIRCSIVLGKWPSDHLAWQCSRCSGKVGYPGQEPFLGGGLLLESRRCLRGPPVHASFSISVVW